MTWARVTKFDRRAVALADRHYSRQQPGTAQFLPPGRTIVMLHETGGAVWALCENLPPGKGAARQWRVSIFRSEIGELASELIREVHPLALAEWVSRYGALPTERLTTEIDPARVRKKRDPGRCFRKAGWERLPDRRGLVVFGAPRCAGVASAPGAAEVQRPPEGGAEPDARRSEPCS